jgi:hypothetical protein
MGPWKTGSGVRYLMPLSEYPVVISQKDLITGNAIYRRQIASLLRGNLSGDTICRILKFTRDSNEYLPQAPYGNLLGMIKNFTLSGELRAYTSKDLSIAMTKANLEANYVSWDSTNQVADPGNPGVFIIAPIKSEGQVKTFLICEKWIPLQSILPYGKENWMPKPYMGYGRTITAYGMVLSSNNTFWFAPDDLNKVLAAHKFNMTPYEECFRAERFKTLQIQVPTW